MQWLISYYEEANAFAHDNLNKKADAIEEWDELIKGSKPNVSNRRNAPARAAKPKECVLERMKLIRWKQYGYNDGSTSSDPSCPSYNAFCPTWYTPHCGHTVVGCIAVAMGMVMRYYQWPHAGIIPYHAEPINNYVEDLHMGTYDWKHMPDELHNTTDINDANMIASLLRDCGYACRLNYGKDLTGADNLKDATTALQECFGYSTAQHKNYFFIGWLTMLKKEIDAGRPVIYAGKSELSVLGGHVFVLYGYKNNLFRVNWGWGDENLTETYYALDDIVTFRYTKKQEAIIGIEPNYPECGQDYVLYNTVVSKLPFLPLHCSGVITTSADFYGRFDDSHIRSSQFGYIYSGEEVRLKAPFYIDKGANIHIAIRDAHCGGRNNMPAKISNEVDENENGAIVAANEFYVSPNPATDYIEIHSSSALKSISIINSNGQCVFQSTNTFIPTYSLPSGLYIVRAITEDNNMLQTKFLKN